MRDRLDHGQFTHHGREMRWELFTDPDSGPPWENDDGVGIVSDWRPKASKKPGEVIINTDHDSCRLYDVQATTEKARKDGWGLSQPQLEELAQRLGYPFWSMLSKGEIAAEAVRLDIERMYGWCNDDWFYVGVVVTDLISGESESCWCIESDGGYWKEVRDDLASQLHPEAEAHEAANLEVCSD